MEVAKNTNQQKFIFQRNVAIVGVIPVSYTHLDVYKRQGLVYGHNAAMKSVELLQKDEFNYFDLENVPEWNDEGMKVMEEKVLITYLRKQLQEMMSDLVGIVRSNERLKLAQKKQREIFDAVTELYNYSVISPELSELRNLVNVSYLIIKNSLEMKENKGAFYNKDFVKV